MGPPVRMICLRGFFEEGLTSVRYRRTCCGIKSRGVRHRGVKRLIESDDDREIRRDLVRRVRNILAALITAEDMSGVQGPPGWRIHQLSGDRARTWTISVSGNWRITFDLEDEEICNLNLEDYH
jgi:toxin HigB-1